jgi:hypothetical protein
VTDGIARILQRDVGVWGAAVPLESFLKFHLNISSLYLNTFLFLCSSSSIVGYYNNRNIPTVDAKLMQYLCF